MPSLRRYRTYFDYYAGRAKYLFIHIPKNAGVAMRRSPGLQGKLAVTEPWFYKSRSYAGRLRRTMKANNEHHGFHHARLCDVDPGVRRRLQPIAVIRNPWSRVVSRYRFAKLVVAQGHVADTYAAESFEEFLEQRHLFGNKEFYWHRAIRGWYPQVDYVRDEQGKISADLLRQEHLSEEADRYFDSPVQLRRRNVSGQNLKPYQEYYSPRTIQIVADWYAADIDTFGFRFDSAATRNVCFSGSAANADAASKQRRVA